MDNMSDGEFALYKAYYEIDHFGAQRLEKTIGINTYVNAAVNGAKPRSFYQFTPNIKEPKTQPQSVEQMKNVFRGLASMEKGK